MAAHEASTLLDLLHNVLETIPDRVWLKDLNGIYLFCNTAYAEHLGASNGLIIGTGDTQWVGAQMAIEFRAADRLVLETGKTLTFEGPMPSPDPPRAGMHADVVQTILDLAPKRIVYVSCNPATQARDLQLLSAKYDIIQVQPVDMFPHTFHIENVAELYLKATN